MSLDKLTTSDLLYCLRQQYRVGIHTCNPCVACGQTAIGKGHCRDCIVDELKRRIPDDDYIVFELVAALHTARDAYERADKVARRIEEMAK